MVRYELVNDTLVWWRNRKQFKNNFMMNKIKIKMYSKQQRNKFLLKLQ